MPYHFTITLGTNTPIYWQIVDQICKGVASGDLAPGTQLPSVRALADELIINPNTVARAYSDLVKEGILETHRGKGVYVADRRQVISDEERLRRLDQALDGFIHEIMLLDLDQETILASLNQRLDALRENKDN